MKGSVFVKKNSLSESNSLECEHKGLLVLHESFARHGLYVPNIISINKNELCLEKVQIKSPTLQDFRMFGEKFGLDYDNYIGLNRQINTWHINWGEFFVICRLDFQINLISNKKVKLECESILKNHKTKVIDFLNKHKPKPSLLHGDL
ncbi:MAG: hypothetical protein A2Z20_03535 [Bdellovibrionales bacterium RBG_16_40_8]|nr:MAG: hypothetical protein A2Z20_03535 [Bdellovibrionales bacterium RBG_16_40_8]